MSRRAICKACRISFVTSIKHKKTCSIECRGVYARIRRDKEKQARISITIVRLLTCACGKSFNTVTPTQVACSPQCWYKYYRKRVRKPYQCKPIVKNDCVICGLSFKSPRDRKTCSVPCWNTFRRQRTAEARAARILLESMHTCEHKGCSNRFGRTHRPGKKFCSGKCSSAAYRARLLARRPQKAPDVTKVGQTTSERFQGYPCASCAHGRASTVADLGWECAKVWAGLCRPFAGAVKFERKQQ